MAAPAMRPAMLARGDLVLLMVIAFLVVWMSSPPVVGRSVIKNPVAALGDSCGPSEVVAHPKPQHLHAV